MHKQTGASQVSTGTHTCCNQILSKRVKDLVTKDRDDVFSAGDVVSKDMLPPVLTHPFRRKGGD